MATGRPRKDPRDPVLTMRDAGLEPLKPYPGSDKPWRCRNEACGSEVTPRLGDIAAGRQGGCGYCSGTAPIPPEEAVALMRSAGLEPLEPYPGATLPGLCRHVSCGREVKPRCSYTRRGGSPCRWCAHNAPVDPDQATALMRSAGLEPLEPYAGTDVPWRCRCTTCGTIGTPTHGSVKRGQGGCGPCGRKNAGRGISRAWSRRRELPRTDGDPAAAEAKDFDLEPAAVLPGTERAVTLPPPRLRPRRRDQVEQPQARPSGLPVLLSLPGWPTPLARGRSRGPRARRRPGTARTVRRASRQCVAVPLQRL